MRGIAAAEHWCEARGRRGGGQVSTEAEPERMARVQLSFLADPGDLVLGALLRESPAAEVVTAVTVGEGDGDGGLTDRRDIPGLGRAVARWRARLGQLPSPARLAAWERAGIRLVCPGEPEWPTQLDDLGDARPVVLWLRGSADLRYAGLRSVSMVGSRAATAYGHHVCTEMAAALAGRGFTVISGGPEGVKTLQTRTMVDQDRCAFAGRSRPRYPQLPTPGLLCAWPLLATGRKTATGEFFDHLHGWVTALTGTGQEPEPDELASPACQPGEVAGGDRPERCPLAPAAGSFLAGAPGRPRPVPQLPGHHVPAAAAHQAGPVEPITAAGYRTTAGRQQTVASQWVSGRRAAPPCGIAHNDADSAWSPITEPQCPWERRSASSGSYVYWRQPIAVRLWQHRRLLGPSGGGCRPWCRPVGGC
jgi:DNA recombination-mediator protein A